MKPPKRPILKFLFLLIPVLGIVTCSAPGDKLRPGQFMTNFQLDTLTHQRFYLNQQTGKPVVLVFWATWCRYCKTEMVELQPLTRLPGWQDVVIASVCTDPENLSDVKDIVSHLNITYPVLLDHNGQLFNKYGLTTLPTTLIIDQNQRLCSFKTGYDANILNLVKDTVANLGK